MAHPYSKHGENAVGHRRAKFLTTGKQYARGGHTDEAEDKKLIKKEIKKYEAEEKATGGSVNGGRLDKRARGGGVQKFQIGGGVRKITPSKHKPHVGVNIVNIHRPVGGGGAGMRQRVPLAGVRPAVPAGGGLPVAPPIRPAGIPAVPPMKRGGRAKFAAGGRMRTGKKYGEGSGEGRLEEYHHMKGR